MPAPSTRERILAAARDLLARGGPRAITVGAIAAAVGVSAPALYKHFANRDAIVQALRQEGFVRFGAALAPDARARGALAQLLDVGERYVRFGLEEPSLYRLLFMSADEVPPSEREREAPDDAGLRGLVALVEACQREGALDPESDAYELAVAYWATCHGLVSLYLAGGGASRFTPRAYRALAKRALGQLARAR